jgi:hypothetical protein
MTAMTKKERRTVRRALRTGGEPTNAQKRTVVKFNERRAR